MLREQHLAWDVTLTRERFGFEPEITVKIAKHRPRIYEIGVSYSGPHDR
jgi:hypothetical protein